ncbi:hypothetical protein RO3G_02823 [Rhizopus delemar RA 99-880]|uniref:Uncharacterized protein n=1 Tax=Rhizopus delemar (strain RA 99-880 / ATCC MYA-4621 / FGSC 9543 / NRRL 43880) TaxID=246409 RepID=I1BPI9_RHIO9|nr:hypothetical protein RO3G_02823 [Rhizopus delemar RA 99-880]|eukprot:EIE78119.1 hypothetical protein RO3G_02823 [Rhizopus delemar RA 99-880]
MPNKNLYICVCPEVCAIKANGYDIVKKSTFERHEVTRQYSTIYSTYPVHHLHGQHVNDDMLTMFGQSESQITEAMEVDSSTNLEEIDDNGEAIDFDNVDLDLDDDYEDQFNENADETPMYTNRSFPPLDEPLSLYLFFFVILFKTKFLTDDQTELLMECMNVVLLFTNMKYRFPVEATTLLSSSELLKRCYEGVTQYSVCKGCHRLYRLNENGRSTVTVVMF